MQKKDEKKQEQQEKLELDKDAQKALAYLSGISPTEVENIRELILPVTPEEHAVFDDLVRIWLRLQEDEIREIGTTLIEVLQCLGLKNKKVKSRIESPEYLRLVRKSFRNWSAVENEEKRVLIRNTLISAATKKTSPDYAISLFIDWVDRYSKEHITVLRHLYEASPAGLTRKELWLQMHKGIPSEDSAEADLYKMLILDLTMGYLIRQSREKDFYGKFVRAKPQKKTEEETNTRVSTFDDTKRYVLTELGKQFVSYILEEDYEK